jgi:hypothetical protein
MAKGDSLADGEVILRRFDADAGRANHWVEPDDGSPARLTGAAFGFKPSKSGWGDECSIYQDSELPSLGIGRKNCIQRNQVGWDIATSTAEAVRGVKVAPPGKQGEPNPFGVVEDRYPKGVKRAPRRDGAHAEIILGLTGSARRRWVSTLANTFKREAIY